MTIAGQAIRLYTARILRDFAKEGLTPPPDARRKPQTRRHIAEGASITLAATLAAAIDFIPRLSRDIFAPLGRRAAIFRRRPCARF